MAARTDLHRPSSDTQASLSWNGHARRKHSCILWCKSEGFAAVVYYRWQISGHEFQVQLVHSKAKVAPIKTLSIPRLELQAAVLPVRLVEATKRSSRKNIKSVLCWRDSQNTLAWIRAKDVRFSVFVSNRVAEIHDCTRPADWHYVPTSLNIADGASHGHSLEVLLSTSEWTEGPEFLRHEESQWPVEQKFRSFFVLRRVNGRLNRRSPLNLKNLLNRKFCELRVEERLLQVAVQSCQKLTNSPNRQQQFVLLLHCCVGWQKFDISRVVTSL